MLTGSKLSGVGRMGHSSKKMLAVPVASNAAAQSFSLSFTSYTKSPSSTVFGYVAQSLLKEKRTTQLSSWSTRFSGISAYTQKPFCSSGARDAGILSLSIILPCAVYVYWSLNTISAHMVSIGSGAFPVFSAMPTRLKHLFPSPAVVEKPCPPTEYVSAAEENSNDTNPASAFSPS